MNGVEAQGLPEEWLKLLAEKLLTDEEKAEIEAMGGFEKLMETLQNAWKNRKAAMKVAPNGSAPQAPRRLGPMAIILKACGLARRAGVIARR